MTAALPEQPLAAGGTGARRGPETNPREWVLRALRGQGGGHPPLTAPVELVPRSQVERELRNAGLCLVARGPALFRETHHNAVLERVFSGKDGNLFERLRVRTSAGELSSVVRHAKDRSRSWTTERLFKGPRDYLPLMALFQDQRFEANFDDFARYQEAAGGDLLVCPNLGPSPLHYITHTLMGLETFAKELSQRREQVQALYKSLAESHRRRLMQAAKSPALAMTYGGQLQAGEIGADRFEHFYLPQLREFADLMHVNGKLAGIQVLGDPRPLAEAIGRTHVDYIEGLQTTAGMSLAEARRAWPEVALWVEVPPAVHLLPEEGIEGWLRDLLRGAPPGGRLVLSAGDGLPPQRWQRNLTAIHKVLAEEAASPAAEGG